MTRPNQTLEERSSFGDSSWPLFSIYSDAAKQEDSDLVKLWQKDAEGIIIFVSPRVGIHASHINSFRLVYSLLHSLRSLL